MTAFTPIGHDTIARPAWRKQKLKPPGLVMRWLIWHFGGWMQK